MYMTKRFFSIFFAFALCAVLTLGSLSFMPKSFAVYNYSLHFNFDVTSLQPNFLGISYYGYNQSFDVWFGSGSFSGRGSGNGNSSGILSGSGSFLKYRFKLPNVNLLSINASDLTGPTSQSSFTWNGGGSCPVFVSSELPFTYNGVGSSNVGSITYTFDKPTVPRAVYWDFSPFYFPELPHGEFDGNINVLDGHFNVDLGSVTGTTSNTGDTTTLEHYSFVVPYYNVTSNSSSSDFDFNDTTGIGHVQNSDYTSGNYTVTGQTTNTVHYVETGSVDINGSAPVLYVPAYNENSRFRVWSCVMDSSYVWFVSDTRNKITGSIVSVTSDEVTWKYEFSDPQGGNTIYPTWAIVFSPMGEVIQVLSPTTVSNKNTYTLSCSIGTLEQDQDTGIWSCDPLYHGFWFSDDSPPVSNITHLNVAENKKYLANPVFGESAFQLNFLDSINRGIADINSNIQSLQSAMQSSISGQTSAFQNMDAPSAPQPSTSQMMDYFSKESAFSAPNTDEVFSGDIKSGHYWDGVTWWSSKFNDIIVSNQVIVAFTTAMLTLGLAVLIIGRRFSMR